MDPAKRARPRVSVLLPFYNAATTLTECLDSIYGQTFADYELIAVDDGSTDRSATLVARAADRDPRIRVLRPGRQGLVGALNTGLAACRAPLVARMDADDLMHRERLRLQQEYFQQHPEVALLGTRVQLFPQGAVRPGYREYLRWQNECVTAAQIRNAIYLESPFAHPSVMFRRDVVLALGGYRAGDFPEDYELWLRLHHHGHTMAKLKGVLLDWREGEQRLSRTHPAYSRDAFDRLRAEYLRRDPRLPRDRMLVYWGAGRRTRQRARHLIDQGFPPDAWIDIDPHKIGNRVGGAWVHAPQWLERQPRPFVLSYVANHGARDWIGEKLRSFGYREGTDYLFVG